MGVGVAPTAVAPEALSFAVARERVLTAVTPLPVEPVPLESAAGRALRIPVHAVQDLPPFRNASMDGVVVRSRDVANATPSTPAHLRAGVVIAAGHPAERPLDAGECMWIMTGAPLPEGGDAVIPIEDLAPGTAPGVASVAVGAPARSGLNVRDAGADLRAGELALAVGCDLSPHDIGLAAAVGVSTVSVGRKPRVAVISTGDELQEAGGPLRPGAIRDSNRPMLAALLRDTGVEAVSMTHVGDDPEVVAVALETALAEADVVITIGGVSAGSHDPVKVAIGRIGEIALWRVAMKPGRPQAFGAPRGRLFFGLPGNPASVACVYEVLVRPALRKLQGFSGLDRPRLRVRAAHPIESRPGRVDFVRVTLAPCRGGFEASEAGAQVSGHLTPQSRAHALLVVPEGTTSLAAGDEADALVLRWPER